MPNASVDDAAPPAAPSWSRTLIRLVGGTALAVLLLVSVLVAALQIDAVATRAARAILQRVNPLPGTALSIDGASGTWVGSLQLTGVTLRDTTQTPHAPLATLDTLRARYALWPLLAGTVHIYEARAVRPTATFRQTADSTWNWAQHLPPPSPDTTQSGFAFWVEAATLTDGRVTTHFYSPRGDSTLRTRGLQLRMHALRYDSTLAVTLDTLGLTAHLPQDTTTLTLSAGGALSATHLRDASLRLRSPYSHVVAQGTLARPSAQAPQVHNVDASLRATPLAFRDLTTLIPALGLDPSERVTIDARVAGAADSLGGSLEATFGDGGTVQATALAATGDTTRYRLTATVRRLTTSLLGPPDPTKNRYNVAVRADVRGPSGRALSGTTRVQVWDAAYQTLQVDTLHLDGMWASGRLALRGAGRTNAARLRFAGTARPLADRPTYDLETEVRDGRVQALLAGGLTTALNGSVRVQGAGADSVDATLRFARSKVNRAVIAHGRFTGALRADSLHAQGRAAIGRGTLQLAGHAHLTAERFRLSTGRLDRVDVAALVNDTTQSLLTASLQAQGRGFDPETLTTSAELTVPTARYGAFRVDSLLSRFSLNAGALRATVRTLLNEGRLAARVDGQPFAATPVLRLRDGTFQRIDVGALTQNAALSSRLNGTFRGDLRGAALPALQARLDVRLDTSRLNLQRLITGQLSATLANGAATASTRLQTPTGALVLRGRARPFADVPTAALTEGSFRSLDAGALAGQPDFHTSLTGSLTGSLRGFSWPALTAEATMRIDTSAINTARVLDGTVRFTAAGGTGTATGRLRLAGDGRLTTEARFSTAAAQPTYRGHVHARALNVGALAGLDTLHARLDTLRLTFDGRGTRLSTATATAQLWVHGSRLQQLRVDSLRAAAALRDGLLRLDTLRAETNVALLTGRGGIALTQQSPQVSDLTLQATLQNIAPLRGLIGAQRLTLETGRMTAHVYGTADRPRFDATATLENAIYNAFQAGRVNLNVAGRYAPSAPWTSTVEARAAVQYLALPTQRLRAARATLAYEDSTAQLTASATIDDERSAEVTGTWRQRAATQRLTIDTFALRLAEAPWQLAQPAVVEIGPSAYYVQHFLLANNQQQLSVDGRLDFNGVQHLGLSAYAVDIAPFAALFGKPGLGGTLTGHAMLSGQAAHPTLDSRWTFDVRSEGRPVGRGTAQVTYDRLALAFDAQLSPENDTTSALYAAGRVPVDLRLRTPQPVAIQQRPVRIDVRADAFAVNWIDPFLDPTLVTDVRGVLQADLSIRGTLDTPQLSGTARLRDGGAYVVPLDLSYRNAAATLAFAREQVRVETVRVQTSNGGTLQGNGRVNLSDLTLGTYAIDLRANEFLAIDTRAYRGTVIDGAVRLTGTTQRPALDGQVNVRSADIYFAEATNTNTELASVQLSRTDLLAVERRFGLRLSAADTTTFDAYQALAMDLQVQIARDTWLRSESNPEMRLQLTGRLDMEKEAMADAQVFGTIEVVPELSTITQFGQQFQVDEGTLTFNGNPTTPYINFTAVYEKQAREVQATEVTITLSVEGRPDNLDLTFSSNPPMSTRNILSYLATGQPADELFSASGGEGGSLPTQLAIGQLTGLVENLATGRLGFDVVRIQVQPSGTSYFTVGRYVTPQFYVSVQQPVTNISNLENSETQAPDVTLEYSLTNYMLLRLQRRESSLRLNVLLEYAY
ncbi:translocation/assembly module TamB [Salisaeta longa]|uniref:translocation/assembly module TamB n=1 Tax=Salisaeta longa TaxID=503170 RepID=UPI0004910B0B|nr:translocation/assembly module TamB [Salisaeta longa]